MFRDNGQLGFGANGAHPLLFTECRVENNNTKGFDRGWEAGGDKLVLCRGAILWHLRLKPQAAREAMGAFATAGRAI